jgi:hypothetical protein
LTERFVVHSWVLTRWSPSNSLIMPQSLLVCQQCENRWAAVSWVCLQSGQNPQFVHPLLARWSAVQSLFCMANHAIYFYYWMDPNFPH